MVSQWLLDAAEKEQMNDCVKEGRSNVLWTLNTAEFYQVHK